MGIPLFVNKFTMISLLGIFEKAIPLNKGGGLVSGYENAHKFKK